MKDLDFDELDRAVNSLITKDSTIPSAGNSASGVAYVEPITEETEHILELGEPISTNDGILTETKTDDVVDVAPISIKPAIEKPSTGRFMDVVHPSSNMRSSLVMPERSSVRITSDKAPISRAPLLSSLPSLHLKPTEPSVVSQPANFVSDDTEDDDIDRISNDIDKTLNMDVDDSQISPFLSGTKVEKRPLGAFSTSVNMTPEVMDSPSDDAASSEAAPTPLMAPAIAPPVQPSSGYNPTPSLPVSEPSFVTKLDSDELDAPLPAELQNELLSIESDEMTAQPETTLADIVNEPDTAPNVAPQAIEPSTTSAPVSISTSIQPQYKEMPSSGDQDNGAIYDVKNYHKTVSHPSDGKSGWMWVVWIALMLIVGVGIGAAVYFLVLPQL